MHTEVSAQFFLKWRIGDAALTQPSSLMPTASMETHIYTLRDPRTGVTRYIGKTRRRLSVRLNCHNGSARAGENTRKGRWIRELQKLGMEPRIDLVQTVGGDGSAEEIEWIAKMRAMQWPLVNLTDGGDGLRSGTHSPETIEKMRAIKRGKKQSAETIERRVSKVRGRKNTPEQRRKISLGQTGKKWPEWRRNEQSNRFKGRAQPWLHTPDAIAKRLMKMAKGESHRNSFLTAGQVRQIRQSDISQVLLAKEFGVSQSHISKIKSGKSRKHDQ